MNISELLRALADKLDSINQGSAHEPEAHSAELTPVEVDNTDHSEDSVYIAPLQQKLELLKKAAGVESHYDGEAEEAGELDSEMDIMKRNAGIPVAIQISSEDNDVLEDKQ